MFPEPRRVAVAYGLLRVAVGIACTAAPGRALGPLVRPGEVTPATRFTSRLAGVRDMVLGAGALAARDDPAQLRRWALAGALADAGDAVVTLASFGHLRPRVRLAVLGAAAGGAATGAHAWYHLGRRVP